MSARLCFAGASLSAAFALFAPLRSSAQVATGEDGAAIPGSAVVHVSPIEADTLPILCRDRDRPELGFVTESEDSEWRPRIDLSFSRSGVAASNGVVALEVDGTHYSTTITAGESGDAGYYTVVATVTADGAAPRMISFTAHCRERLVRGG